MRLPSHRLSNQSIIDTMVKIIGGTQTAIDVVYSSVTGLFSFTVKVDNAGIEINGSNNLQLKDDGVHDNHLNVDCAGSGLTQDANGALQVNVDDSTIEINTDIVRIKDDGVTKAKINADVAGTNIDQNADGSLEVADATTSAKGVVQLSDSYTGTSQTLATTEKALSDGLATRCRWRGASAGDPGNNLAGDIYKDTSDSNKIKIYDGTSYISLT